MQPYCVSASPMCTKLQCHLSKTNYKARFSIRNQYFNVIVQDTCSYRKNSALPEVNRSDFKKSNIARLKSCTLCLDEKYYNYYIQLS